MKLLKDLLKKSGIKIPQGLLKMIKEFEDVMREDELMDSDDEVAYDDEQKQKVINAILRRIKTSKNNVDKEIGAQSDLESLEDDEYYARKKNIDNIISAKSKSIADVLLNDGIKKFYGNYF